jgi:NitT/TauT family transport system ATP-binding protein
MSPMIDIKSLTKIFPGHDGTPPVAALDRVSVAQRDGEFLAIMGPSGCGKTTLLNIVAGFETPNSGACNVAGRPVNGTGPDRGVVFQEYALFPWMTVERNVTFAMQAAGKWGSDGPARAREILGRMGLSGFLNAFP